MIILTWLPTRMMPVAQQTATFFDAAVGKLCDVFLAVLQGWPNLSVGNILDRAAANFLKVKFDEYRSRHAQVPDAGRQSWVAGSRSQVRSPRGLFLFLRFGVLRVRYF